MLKMETMPDYLYQKNLRSATKHREPLKNHQERRESENEIDEDYSELRWR